ncbi:unnamed protein product [Rhodiola kirilowii]
MSYNYSASTRCAACKCLRRKCLPDCILAPHFPLSNPQRFAWVHKVFGADNITKMLEQVPVHMRGKAAECMIYEAETRMRDPVYGNVRVVWQLQQQITQVQIEILKIHGEIALQRAQKQTMMHQRSEIVPDIGLGLEIVNGPSGGEQVGSNSGQRYELDLDEMYASFNH